MYCGHADRQAMDKWPVAFITVEGVEGVEMLLVAERQVIIVGCFRMARDAAERVLPIGRWWMEVVCVGAERHTLVLRGTTSFPHICFM